MSDRAKEHFRRFGHLPPFVQMALTGNVTEARTKVPDVDAAHGVVRLKRFSAEDNARRQAGHKMPVIKGEDGLWRALELPGSDWDEMTSDERQAYCQTYNFKMEETDG